MSNPRATQLNHALIPPIGDLEQILQNEESFCTVYQSKGLQWQRSRNSPPCTTFLSTESPLPSTKAPKSIKSRNGRPKFPILPSRRSRYQQSRKKVQNRQTLGTKTLPRNFLVRVADTIRTANVPDNSPTTSHRQLRRCRSGCHLSTRQHARCATTTHIPRWAAQCYHRERYPTLLLYARSTQETK